MNRRDILKLIIIAAVLVFAVLLIERIDSTEEREETSIVKEAVKNAALTCYAVEGAYPEDISYLWEHYHLSYDENQYYVTYLAFAPNVIPAIYITEKGATLH